MQVSQIFFTDENIDPPDQILNCIQTVKNAYGDMVYVLYKLDEARSFLRVHLGNEVLIAFDKLVPYAYKADLFRYCLMYVTGGWYFDVTIKIETRLDIPEYCDTVAFRDVGITTNSSWTILNGILFSRPGSAVYKMAINMILDNSRNLYYGSCSLCPTGPNLLGKAFAAFGDSSKNLFFNYNYLTPGYAQKNPALLFPDGTIFAFLKNTGNVGVKDFCAAGINNYAEIYALRNIYGEHNKIVNNK